MAKGDVLQFKQEKFCREYVKNGGNATQAYKDAGYVVANDNVAAVNADRLLRNRKVIDRLNSLKAPQENEDILTIDERRKKLTAIVRDAELSPQDWMKAIDLLNKMDSLYLQRQEIQGAVPVVLADDISD